MKTILRFFVFLMISFFGWNAQAQTFPNPASLSTGQGAPGTLDPIWQASIFYASNPPNPIGLAYTPALINNNCAPGAWVDPATLPPPVNNGNWITGQSASCANNTADGYMYFRLTLDLPADCNGNSVATSGNYVLYFDGYVDNTITDIFVNGNSTGISGGAFAPGSQLSITLPGPWVVGTNYVDVQVHNFANGGQANPYGLLLVANSAQSTVADGDNDGIADINDLCPCENGVMNNGCNPVTISGDTVLCAGDSTTLTASGSSSYVWSNGATTASITVAPLANTTYHVTGTLTNGYVDSSSVSVDVFPNYSQNIAVTICQNETYTLPDGNVVNTAGPYTINLNSVNGCDSMLTFNVTVLPTSSSSISVDLCQGDSYTLPDGVAVSAGGIYTATIPAVNTCDSTITVTITMRPLFAQTISDTICQGDSYTLPDGNNVSVAGTYDFSYTSQFGCDSIVTVLLTVTTVTVNAVATDVLCFGQNNGSIAVTTTGLSPFSFSFSQSGNLIGTNATGVLQNLSAGNYDVSVTDFLGCTATTTANINEPTALQITATADSVTCFGNSDGSISIATIGGTAPYTVLISGNNGIISNANNLAAGNYNFVVTDFSGCADSGSVEIFSPAPITVQLNPDTAVLQLGESLQLNASSNYDPNVIYTWSPSQGLSCADCANPTVSTYNSVVYAVTAQYNAGSAVCEASATLPITVIPNYNIFVPNAFSPNGDGANDYFELYGNKSAIKQLQIKIFNRVGEKVFESNDINFKWNGTYKGETLSSTILVYQLSLVFLDNHSDSNYGGSLSLLR